MGTFDDVQFRLQHPALVPYLLMLDIRRRLTELNDDVDRGAVTLSFESVKISGQLVLSSISKGGANRKQANYNRHQHPSAPCRTEHPGIDEFLFSLEPSHGRTPRLCQVGRNVDFGITVCSEKRPASETAQGRGHQFCYLVRAVHKFARLPGVMPQGRKCMWSAKALGRQSLVIKTVRAIQAAEARRQFVTQGGSQRQRVSDRCGPGSGLHFNFHL